MCEMRYLKKHKLISCYLNLKLVSLIQKEVVMRKKTPSNPRGAGRNKNTWNSRKMTVPDPIRSEVKKLIDSWIKENK